MAVADSANKYWGSVEKGILGIQSDLTEGWRRSFVAVIEGGQSTPIYERLNPDCKEILYQGTFSDMKADEEIFKQMDIPTDNLCYVSSHAMGKNKYTKCAIVINGENYAFNKRGLNIVVYSKALCCVIDSVYVDLWADATLSVRRE